MKSIRAFALLLLITLALSASFAGNAPSWIMETPSDTTYYYFTGTFSADNESKAINGAKAEVVGTILFMINSTVSASSTFETTYRRRSGQADTQDSRLFKKIKTKGAATVSRLEFKKTYTAVERGKVKAYVLARMPKVEINNAIKKVQEERARLQSMKSACIIVVKYPDGDVVEADVLKGFLEKFYKDDLGYNIVESNVDVAVLGKKNLSQMRFELKKILSGYQQVVFGLVDLVERPQIRTSRAGDISMKTVRVHGNFILGTIELKTMRVVESATFEAWGTAGGDRASEREAMNDLVSEFKKQLLGDESSAGGRDAVFD